MKSRKKVWLTAILVALAITMVPISIWLYQYETTGKYKPAEESNHIIQYTFFSVGTVHTTMASNVIDAFDLNPDVYVWYIDNSVGQIDTFKQRLSAFDLEMQLGDLFHFVNANQTQIGTVNGFVFLYQFNPQLQVEAVVAIRATDIDIGAAGKSGIRVIKI